MKRISAPILIAMAAILLLAACSHPTLTEVPAPTLADPTTVVPPPTEVAQPSATPTASSFSGTAVSFDMLKLVIPGEVATGGSGTLVPEGKKDEVAPWDVGPEHLQLILDGYALEGKMHPAGIYVYPTQDYVRLQERGAAALSLQRLQTLLAQSTMIDLKELPEVPFFNVPQALAAQVKVIPFQNGRGVRMVTEYAMGHAIINNHELIYHFEGLTDDGQYYVIAILPVTAPGLPEDGQPGSVVPAGGVAVPDFNDIYADWLGYYGEVQRMLQGLQPGAFEPGIDQLDALIGSIGIGE